MKGVANVLPSRPDVAGAGLVTLEDGGHVRLLLITDSDAAIKNSNFIVQCVLNILAKLLRYLVLMCSQAFHPNINTQHHSQRAKRMRAVILASLMTLVLGDTATVTFNGCVVARFTATLYFVYSCFSPSLFPSVHTTSF